MIKDNETTNRSELTQQGWVYDHSFGTSSEVWRKENRRCMWNTKTYKVILVYDSNTKRYATTGY